MSYLFSAFVFVGEGFYWKRASYLPSPKNIRKDRVKLTGNSHVMLTSRQIPYYQSTRNSRFYFIPSNNESNAYLKRIKVVLSTVKEYRIFSLVTSRWMDG